MSSRADGTDPVRRARNAVALVFYLNGLAFASWASRIPDTRHRLGLDDQQLGLLLLGLSLGSVVALPLAGGLVRRWGAARVVGAGAIAVLVALVGIAVGVSGFASVPMTVAFLMLYGVGSGVWDVAMNVDGAEVERRLGRSVMPRFHAAFSLGTVTGALVGALAAHRGPDLRWHLIAVAVLVGVPGVVAARRFLPARSQEAAAPRSAAAWLEPRTLLIGVVVLAMALAEGTANDWLALALRDGHHASAPTAVLGFALFVTAMTTGRLVGPALLDRWGRVPVLLATVVLAAGGVLATVHGGGALVVLGIALWGLGASLGFPVGMSAAADDPTRAPARLSVVATIGYTAFLAGPPLLGFVAARVGTLDALVVVVVVLLPAALAAPLAMRPPPARR